MSKITRVIPISVVCLVVILVSTWLVKLTNTQNSWTSSEINILRSLWIGSLPPLPQNPSNAVADNNLAAEFGYQLFFDKRFSANAQIACANCHQPEMNFTDGLRVSVGATLGIRNSMSIVGVAYSSWLFWDGRKDSLWSQALAPLENSLEHAGSRMQFAHIIAQDENYRSRYEKLFGPLPAFEDSSRFPPAAGPVANKEWHHAWQSMRPEDKNEVTKVFVNIGKSIAAYERLLIPGPSRFDTYVEGVIKNDLVKQEVLNHDEISGLNMFIGKAQCVNCHNGALFSNHEFHNTSILPAPGELPSMGRVEGIRVLQADTFNCLGKYSDANENACAELRFARSGDELIGTHKTPSLRNVARTAPYMHAGQLKNLSQIIDHYNHAPASIIGHNEAKPLNLNIIETQQLEAFLHTLSGPLATEKKWLSSPQN